MGTPQIRTVTTGAASSGEGGVMRGMAIRYLDEPILIEDIVGAARETVLPLLIEAFRAEGLTPDGMDVEAGTVSLSRAEWLREWRDQPLSTFLDCGPSSTGRPLADDARIFSAITAQVRGEGTDLTRVTIRLDAVASPLSTLGGLVQSCTTTGEIERAILTRIQIAVAPEEAGPRVQSPDGGTQPAVSILPSRVEARDLIFGPGDHVRIWLSPSERLTGVFLGFNADTLLLKRSRRTAVPLRSVQGVQVKRIRRLPLLVGGVLGLAAGVTVAMTTEMGIGGRHAIQGEILNPGLGAVFGGLFGVGVGYLFGRSWLDVPLEGIWPDAPRGSE